MAKRKVIILGLYLPGIYPRGEDDVVADLLAPAYMKTVVDADPELSQAYDVEIFNIPTTTPKEEIIENILRKKPYMVAFSVYIWNFEMMHQITTQVKLKMPHVHTVWGGPEVAFNADEMMKLNPQVDTIVCGSGEEKFKRMLRTNMSPEALSTIPSVAYRDRSGEIKKSEGNIPDDLTKIPSPFQSGAINLRDGNRHSVYIETYRGCIFQCGYCMWMGDKKRQIVLFPMEQVIKDIDLIYNNEMVASVVFTDACIFYKPDRAKMICDRIAESKYQIETTLTLDIAFMNEEAIESLNKIKFGQHGFHFGMQSINQETLRMMDRFIGPDLIKKRVQMIKELEPTAEISFDLIYGLPGDTHETFRKTLNFALHLSPIKLNMSPLVLLPGSPYWGKRVEYGFVFDPYPPYLIHSNKTYSAADMKQTRSLVLGVMLVLYYSTIRDTIYQISDNNGSLNRIDLFEEFIRRFEKKTNLILDITGIRDQDQYSPQEVNYIRRSIMNKVSEPQNGVYAYETILEMLKDYGLYDKLAEDALAGKGFYEDLCSAKDEGERTKVELTYRDRYGDNRIDHLKMNWVISKPVGITKETKTGGVAAVC